MDTAKENQGNGSIVPARSGTELYRQSSDAAGLCREIVLATAVQIGPRKYVQIEGWQAVAIAHGCVLSAGEVIRIDDPACPGFAARGMVRRMDGGGEISTAEGFVGDDEPAWAKRPVYARRAMAQTRAMSRAGRSAFAHVVVMMRAGLSTTPAEEVPDTGFSDAPPSARQALDEAQGAGEDVMRISFGKSKGKPIIELNEKEIAWYMDSKVYAGNSVARAALQAELDRRNGPPTTAQRIKAKLAAQAPAEESSQFNAEYGPESGVSSEAFDHSMSVNKERG